MTVTTDIAALDAADPLAGRREAFDIPEGVIYLDGNSLGALPKATPDRLADVIRKEWGQDLIRSWNTAGWIDAAARVGGQIAGVVGAKANEVIVADSTSINLFKLAAGALSLRPGRRKLISEPGNFPTDLYILQGLERLLGDRVEIVVLPVEEIPAAIDEDTAAIVLTQVHYKSGRRWDMAGMTELAHEKGALALWDLSHSAGALAVDLNGCNADLAIGCGYKYLNGGPGAPAFLFVAERHQAAIQSPLTGWMGHAAPFDFVDQYSAAGDIRAQLCGTPPIIGISALEVGVKLLAQEDMTQIEAKGLALGDLFLKLVEEKCPDLELRSPREAKGRGCHVSFAHKDGYAIMQALIERGVIGDFRAPDILRFGFSPLYLSFADIARSVEILAQVMNSGEYKDARFAARSKVT